MQNFKTFCKFLLEMPSVYNHKSRRETRTRGHLWSEAWELLCPPAGFPVGGGQALPSAGEAPSRGTGWTPRPATSLSGPGLTAPVGARWEVLLPHPLSSWTWDHTGR